MQSERQRLLSSGTSMTAQTASLTAKQAETKMIRARKVLVPSPLCFIHPKKSAAHTRDPMVSTPTWNRNGSRVGSRKRGMLSPITNAANAIVSPNPMARLLSFNFLIICHLL